MAGSSSAPEPVQPPLRGPATVHALGDAPSAAGEEVFKRRKHKTNIRVAALNITSMMDLVLNLLLFFVLTANFSISEGVIPATLPTGPGGDGPPVNLDNPTAPPENPIIIKV